MMLFLGDIAFMLEVFALAGGLVVLYFAQERANGLLKAAGYILAIGGVLGILCTGFYWVKYWSQDAFETAHPRMGMQGPGAMGMGPGRMPMGGMMRGQMMGGGMMMGARHQAMTQQMDVCFEELAGDTLDDQGMKALHQCMTEGMQEMMGQGNMGPGMMGKGQMGQGQMGPGMRMGRGPMGPGMRWQQCLQPHQGQTMGPEMRQAMQTCLEEVRPQ